MNAEKTTGGVEQPRDPGWFEDWLLERRDRQDEVGRVARFVLRENHEGRWAPEDVLLARHGHTYDAIDHYERILRHRENWSEGDIETLRKVYDLYQKDGYSEYDRMVEERSQKIGKESGGEGDGNGESTTTTAGEGPTKTFSSQSWERFYYDLLGPEQVGYELDEDGHPISDPNSDVEGR